MFPRFPPSFEPLDPLVLTLRDSKAVSFETDPDLDSSPADYLLSHNVFRFLPPLSSRDIRRVFFSSSRRGSWTSSNITALSRADELSERLDFSSSSLPPSLSFSWLKRFSLELFFPPPCHEKLERDLILLSFARPCDSSDTASSLLFPPCPPWTIISLNPPP